MGLHEAAAKFVSLLSNSANGKALLDIFAPALQWHPKLMHGMSLEYKREWVSKQILATGRLKQEQRLDIMVHRGRLLDGLCNKLQQPTLLRQGINVRFTGDGENGHGNGHRREFFMLAAKQLADPRFGLFKSNDGGRSIHINSMSAETQPDHLAHFELCGKLVGLALLHQETLPHLRFTAALRKLLLGSSPVSVEDLASVDPALYEGKVLYLKEARYQQDDAPVPIEDLDLTFEETPQPEVFPDVHWELLPGGAQIRVTEENKLHYLWLLCDHHVRGSVALQLEALRKGFQELVPKDVCARLGRVVNPSELGLLLCGMDKLDVSEWKAHGVKGEGLAAVTWDRFWAVVGTMSQTQRSELLEFVTGSPTLPAGGFAALPGYGAPGVVSPFTVAPPPRQHPSGGLGLPTAQTCFNKLYMPQYGGEEEMKTALLEAVAHRGSGFYESAVLQ